jgi:hypothetical protein
MACGRCVRISIWALLLLNLSFLGGGCTFYNTHTFALEHADGVSADLVLDELERYFSQVGLRLDMKMHQIYPEDKRYTRYFLGQRGSPLVFYSAYDFLVLRRDPHRAVFIDWIRISDRREKVPPASFEATNEAILAALRRQLAITATFRFVEPKEGSGTVGGDK